MSVPRTGNRRLVRASASSMLREGDWSHVGYLIWLLCFFGLKQPYFLENIVTNNPFFHHRKKGAKKYEPLRSTDGYPNLSGSTTKKNVFFLCVPLKQQFKSGFLLCSKKNILTGFRSHYFLFSGKYKVFLVKLHYFLFLGKKCTVTFLSSVTQMKGIFPK